MRPHVPFLTLAKLQRPCSGQACPPQLSACLRESKGVTGPAGWGVTFSGCPSLRATGHSAPAAGRRGLWGREAQKRRRQWRRKALADAPGSLPSLPSWPAGAVPDLPTGPMLTPACPLNHLSLPVSGLLSQSPRSGPCGSHGSETVLRLLSLLSFPRRLRSLCALHTHEADPPKIARALGITNPRRSILSCLGSRPMTLAVVKCPSQRPAAGLVQPRPRLLTPARGASARSGEPAAVGPARH